MLLSLHPRTFVHVFTWLEGALSAVIRGNSKRGQIGALAMATLVGGVWYSPAAMAQTGVIQTVAGSGTRGYSGDGSDATLAQLSNPTGGAVDGSGNVFIADYGNHRIRKVDASGNISTVAGTGTWGYSGDGSDATLAQLFNPFGVAVDGSGNLFIADYGNHRIRKVVFSVVPAAVQPIPSLGSLALVVLSLLAVLVAAPRLRKQVS